MLQDSVEFHIFQVDYHVDVESSVYVTMTRMIHQG